MTELITPPSPKEMGFNNAAQGFLDTNADLRQKPNTLPPIEERPSGIANSGSFTPSKRQSRYLETCYI